LTEEQLDQLIGARDHRLFLNPKNELYRQRNMREHPPDRAEAIALMAQHPNLIRRPLLVDGQRILIGFQAEEWAQALRR
jgi:arsenate reductase-like glutaredoxin family protein